MYDKITCFGMFALITLLENMQKFNKICHCLAGLYQTRMLDYFFFPSWPKWRDFGHSWPKSGHFGHDGKKKKSRVRVS